jgi:hypothetical protein
MAGIFDRLLDTAPTGTVRGGLLRPPLRAARRAWQEAYWLPRDFLRAWRYKFPRHLVYFGGRGFGDDLLLGTVLHELHVRGYRRLAVVSRLEDIFRHAPFGGTFINEDWAALRAVKRFGGRTINPIYYTRMVPPEYDVPSSSHIITEMCRTSGLTGRVALRTYFYLTSEEKARGRLVENQVVIQCTSAESLNFSPLKQWYQERYQAVVDTLRSQVNFVQLGSAKDPLLEGALDLRGKTTIRESAAILANSRACLTYIGFLMHLARAVDCRAVIIFGGRERPDQAGYACNENLFTPLPCAPCWRRATSLHHLECMDKISTSDVVAAIERILAKGDAPLELAYETIPDHPTEFHLPWLDEPAFAPPTGSSPASSTP